MLTKIILIFIVLLKFKFNIKWLYENEIYLYFENLIQDSNKQDINLPLYEDSNLNGIYTFLNINNINYKVTLDMYYPNMIFFSYKIQNNTKKFNCLPSYCTKTIKNDETHYKNYTMNGYESILNYNFFSKNINYKFLLVYSTINYFEFDGILGLTNSINSINQKSFPEHFNKNFINFDLESSNKIINFSNDCLLKNNLELNEIKSFSKNYFGSYIKFKINNELSKKYKFIFNPNNYFLEVPYELKLIYDKNFKDCIYWNFVYKCPLYVKLPIIYININYYDYELLVENYTVTIDKFKIVKIHFIGGVDFIIGLPFFWNKKFCFDISNNKTFLQSKNYNLLDPLIIIIYVSIIFFIVFIILCASKKKKKINN